MGWMEAKKGMGVGNEGKADLEERRVTRKKGVRE
jgi:hypothetical protein